MEFQFSRHFTNPQQHCISGNSFLDKGENVFKFAALASTLNDLITRSDAPNKIDFLSLDVESAEIEVHNGIDYNNYIFKYKLIESRNFETINNFLKIKYWIQSCK